MKKLCLAGLVLWMVLWSGLAQAAWNADWPKRLKISLDTSATGLALQAPVDGVPVLVRLHTGNFPFLDANADGSDLRFVASDDKTPLKYHIEKFDSINELAFVWVLVPRVNPGVKTDFFWLYHGNPKATRGDDAKGTYDNAQGLVLHFSDTSPLPQDSTANANHAARSSARANPTGLIGGGAAFDGSAELLVADSPSLKAGPTGVTVSFWIKPAEAGDAVLFAQGAGAGALRIALRGGRLTAQLGTSTATAPTALSAGGWQHVAVVVKSGANAADALTLYQGGQEVARAAGTLAPTGGAMLVGRSFKGDIDELQWAGTARSPDWLRTAGQSQGQDQKLVTYGAAEGEGAEAAGPSYIKILLSAVTVDGWIVIAILAVMFVYSLWVMWVKLQQVMRSSRDNQQFMQSFDGLINSIQPAGTADETAAAAAVTAAHAHPVIAADKTPGAPPQFAHSQLYRLYEAGVAELQSRFDSYRKMGRPLSMSTQSLGAIRATVEAGLVREIQRLNSQMVVLTICIAGGPFLGLLGTVVGVMITFAAIAAAGDVNVNAIAPGIAAALVATVAGLIVAIPALFAYNYLTIRIQGLISDMQVFVDELTTRIAENHSV